MLTAREAYHRVLEKYPDYQAHKCFEYEKFYVFSLKAQEEGSISGKQHFAAVIGPQMGVMKDTGTLFGFLPVRFSREELAGRREVDFQ